MRFFGRVERGFDGGLQMADGDGFCGTRHLETPFVE
jgi:hypothetical protein